MVFEAQAETRTESLFTKALGKASRVADSVMFSHALFSLPFVVSAVLLESRGRPDLGKVGLIVVAALGARNAANALNRLFDHSIDAANPRTADRHLVTGTVKRKELWLFTTVMILLFFAATAMLNLLCLALLPIAAAFILIYSFTKRFTWFCHYVLGFTCSMATMGGFLALSGHFELRYFVLMGAVALWVSGFDILYARQDIDFDREKGLFSIPARFGAKKATVFAVFSHVAAFFAFSLLPLFWPLGLLYALGLVCIALLLLSEHRFRFDPEASPRRLRFANYGINQIVAVVFLLSVAADVWLSPFFVAGAWSKTASGLLAGELGDFFSDDLFGVQFWQRVVSLFDLVLKGRL